MLRRVWQEFEYPVDLCRFSGLLWKPENVAQLRAHIVKLSRALSEDLCRKVVTNARVRLQEVVRQNGGHIIRH